MKVKRGVVVDLLTALGFTTAAKMSDDKLMEKVEDLPRIMDEEEYDISDGQEKIMKRLAEAVDEEVEIGLVTSITSKKKVAKKKVAKKKAQPEEEEEAPPKKVAKKTTTKKKVAKKKAQPEPEPEEEAPPKKAAKKKAAPKAKKTTRFMLTTDLVMALPKKGRTVDEISERANKVYTKDGGRDNLDVAIWTTKIVLQILERAECITSKGNKYLPA